MFQPVYPFVLLHHSIFNDLTALLILIMLSFIVIHLFMKGNKRTKIDIDILSHVGHSILAFLIVFIISVVYNGSELTVMVLSSASYIITFIISFWKRHK